MWSGSARRRRLAHRLDTRPLRIQAFILSSRSRKLNPLAPSAGKFQSLEAEQRATHEAPAAGLTALGLRAQGPVGVRILLKERDTARFETGTGAGICGWMVITFP